MMGLASLEHSEDILRATITGDDCCMVVAGLTLEAADCRGARIRMRSPAQSLAEVFFAAGGRPIGPIASTQFVVVASGQFHDYEVDLSSVPGWSGLVSALRIDPVGAVGDVVEIDAIHVVPVS